MPDESPTLLYWLLDQSSSIDTSPQLSVLDWKRHSDQASQSWNESGERAIIGGFLADRLAYAFAAGYHSAIQCLTPEIPLDSIAAFCVSEKGGGHPRAIKTQLVREASKGGGEAWSMKGTKTFVTCANEADLLLIAASTGVDEKGRNRLRMVQISRDTDGLDIKPREKLSFIPEISHGIVELNDVMIEDSQLMPGDAYAEYIKPFGTIEDIHILAAFMGHLLRTAFLNDWPQDIKGEILAILVSAQSLTKADAKAPDTHIALAGLQRLMRNQMIRIEPHWEKTSEETRNAWERDRSVFGMGQKAKDIRVQSAWAKFLPTTGKLD